MKRKLVIASLVVTVMVTAVVCNGETPVILSSFGSGVGTAAYEQFNDAFTGNWKQYSDIFVNWQASLYSRIFLLILTILPALFFLHFLLIGPKKFTHDGPMVSYFGVFTRFIHWLAAASFSLLGITGLMVIFGKYLGGGSLVMTGRSLHIIFALVFTLSVIPMFLIWLKDMLPALYDLKWLFIMGGYLSKKKNPVPAGRFNAGQKMWFWLATLGGAFMAYTGYQIWLFQPPTSQLRLMVIIHNFLAAGLIGFFLIHLYMSLFAIKGAVTSMITGSKPLEEVQILHSKFRGLSAYEEK